MNSEKSGRKSPKKEKRLTFALLIDWLSAPYHGRILAGITDYIEENGLNFLCYVTGRLKSPLEWEKNRNILFDLISPKIVDGMIIMTPSLGNIVGVKKFGEYIKRYSPIPIISIAEAVEDIPYIYLDNEKGMTELLEHLIDKHGYRRIAFISGPEGNSESIARYNAYRSTLQNHRIKFDPNLVVKGNFNLVSGKDSVRALLDERKASFDAIAAANDDMALGALEELRSRKIRVPEDIAVVGFDDVETSKYATLTTVGQPLYEQGKTAAKMLHDLVNGEKVEVERKLQPKLIIRESCGCFSSTAICTTNNGSYNVKEIQAMPLEEQKKFIVDQLKNLSLNIENNLKKDLYNEMNQVIESFFTDITNGERLNFLYSWNQLIYWAIEEDVNLSILHEILSFIRRYVLCGINNRKKLTYAEDMFQQARLITGEAYQRTDTFQKLNYSDQLEKLNEIGEKLIEELDIDHQMEVVYREFPKMGIFFNYISLYENPAAPLEGSKLILAYNDNHRLPIERGGLSFDTNDLFPDGVLPDDKKHNLLVQAIFQGTDQIGFMVSDFRKQDGRLYEILRDKISGSLKSALLVQKIRNQAQNLEVEVKARTADLTKTNMRLQMEITERKKAEENLKKAMEELEIYNQKLHSLSLRDELTGLYNRRGFMTLGEQHLKYAKRMKKNFLIFFADVDKLKMINDTYGHKEGDDALVKAAELLLQSFRQIDIVARLGGDEYTILAVDSSNNEMDELIGRVQEMFDEYNQFSNKAYVLSVSLGVVQFDVNNVTSFDELMVEADKELYKQKQEKKKNKNIQSFFKKKIG